MQFKHFPASERGKKDIGWLRSHFTFTFSDFYDPSRTSFGSLLAFNDDFLQAGKGFGIHPHLNMEIVSIMLRGTMNHKDNLGYVNVVEEDSVQIMSAGSGLLHEEYNVGEEEVNFLQIWIAPKQQNIRPRYQWRHFPKEKRKNQLQVVVSSEEGLGHCWINQNTKISLGQLDAGHTVSYSLNPVNKCLFIFVMSGTITVSGQEVSERNALGIWETSLLAFSATTPAEFVVIETPIVQK